MTVEQFVLIYKTKKDEKDKEAFIKDHIVKKYVSYNEKIVLCKNIVDNTMYKTINDKKIFMQDSPARFLFFTLILIKTYSDLEIEFTNNPLPYYDTLNEYGLINAFISLMPQSEYSEFSTLLDMTVDDRMTNERDLVSFIETKVDALQLSVGAIREAFSQIMLGENENGGTRENTDGAIL